MKMSKYWIWLSVLAYMALVISVFAEDSDGLIITNVQDYGLDPTSATTEYDVHYNGMDVGATPWWDRSIAGGGSEDYPVSACPDTVKGKTYISTTCNDKWTYDEWNYFHCDVNKDVVIYMAYDSRFNRPGDNMYKANWLCADSGWTFIPDDSIAYLDNYGEESAERYLELWWKPFPAGHIVLPSNQTGGGYAFSPLQWVPIFEVDKWGYNGGGSAVNRHSDDFKLASSNYPNPFNPTTTIHFTMPERSHVKVTVYNLLGHKMDTLIDDILESGYHSAEWKALDRTGSALPSGTYFYRLETENQLITKKMLLMR